jgi:hypothetical protein
LSELLTDQISVGTATLGRPANGLPAGVVDGTDVLLWWGHLAHDAVDDRLAEEVCRRVYGGMGLDRRARPGLGGGDAGARGRLCRRLGGSLRSAGPETSWAGDWPHSSVGISPATTKRSIGLFWMAP